MSSERRFSEVVQIRWDGEELALIDRIAGQMKLSRSEFIRDAVAAYLDGAQDKVYRGERSWLDKLITELKIQQLRKNEEDNQPS